jgi:tetratricopeptide (TPR) repeat protein
MARSKIEVPWEIEFPQVCARCTAPAAKTKRIQRQKSSVGMWYFFFGIIGAAIASAAKGGSLRYDVPYCQGCHRQDRILRVALWAIVILPLAFACGSLALLSSSEESTVLNAFGVVAISLSSLALVIGLPVLAIVYSANQAVHIKRIDERIKSAQLAFRNPSYFEQFQRHNMARIVSFALQHGKKLPVPLDQAINFVSQRIDEQNPRSAESLSGYFERGQLYLSAGEYHRALTDLDRVVEVTGFENPYFLEAQFFRGQAHMHLGNIMQAQTDLENYVQASDNRNRVRQAKGWLKQLRRM